MDIGKYGFVVVVICFMKEITAQERVEGAGD